MDPALVLLLVFMVYSVLLGVCLARMKAINREFAEIKGVIAALGTVQRDASVQPSTQITPEMLQVLTSITGGGNE